MAALSMEKRARPRHAVLLAAGRGSRLGSLTEETPKCLLPVGGRSLLDHQLEALAAAGVTDVTVVAGFQAALVESHIAGRCRVIRNELWATTNSVASLHLAAPYVRGHAFIFQNADVLYRPQLVARFVESSRENACLVDPLAPFAESEYHVELRDGQIIRYSREVPPNLSAGRSAQLVRIGAADNSGFLDRIAELATGAGAQGFPNLAYDVLMAGGGLWPVFTAGLPWWEVDTADDYARCRAAFEPSASEEEPLTPGTWARLRELMRERRLPWRLAWLPTVMRSGLASPVQAAAEVRAYRHGELSREALDLVMNGLPFLRLLIEEAKGCEITLMLLWGTLLGCVRDGRLIRGDHDLDLGVMARDVGKLPILRERMLQRGFRVRIENSEKLSLVHPRHPGLYLDIDVVRPHPRGWV
ncbi:MAG TPA: phosphocholine cytidylyltransferase family protein, partial [Gemmatimonadales bacterium]|nr:phosphocholine cytidylyltransferase family protein [Gemmatimonadales bacterium]